MLLGEEKKDNSFLCPPDTFFCLLTDRGILLTFGRGREGQLGHGGEGGGGGIATPRIVEALLGDEVSKVACGRE